MTQRRGFSRNFNVEKQNLSAKFGIKSPHVLDLRKKITREIPPQFRSNPLKKKQLPKELDNALVQEYVLRELAKIENRDVELALSISNFNEPVVGELARGLIGGQSMVMENDKLVSNFFQKKEFKRESIENNKENPDESLKFYFKKSQAFILAAALISGFLVGGFFVHRGIAVKDQTMQKGLLAYKNFASAKDALKDFNFKTAGKDFAQAYEGLVSAEEELGKIGETTLAIVKNMPFESRADSSLALLTAAKHTAKAGEILSLAFTLLPMQDAVSAGAFLKVLAGENTVSGQAGYLVETFDVFTERLSAAEAELLIARTAMTNVRAEDFPEGFKSNITEMNERIPALIKLVGAAKDYAAISSLLLGREGPKRYLILFQNSSELRPTGGFIGTYGLVEIENGGLKNMQVEGIYDADGQLVVNVVPPKPIQHIATSWSTHDANWFLDFPTSAQKITWFFERTGKGKVDGVMTLNIEVIERLLELTGPVEIKQYGLFLSSSNFRDEIQYEVEAAYDKKLNKPKKVLADFTPLFLERLLEASKEKNKELISVLINALEEKYIMLYFNDDRVQGFFEKQGWGGRIIESRIKNPARGARSDSETRREASQGRQELNNDYLAVAHSNIGGYKTDKYMEDSADYNIEIQDDGSMIGNLTVRRKHNGGNSKYWWYNRKNTDYVKIYVPAGAEIVSSSGGTRRTPDAPDYKTLGFSEDQNIAAVEKYAKSFGPLDVFEETGKTVFGTWLITNAGSSKELKISYKLPLKIDFNNDAGKYNLYWQKQPGTKISANFSASVPSDWQIIWDNASAGSAQASDLEQSFALDKDKVIGYIFSK